MDRAEILKALNIPEEKFAEANITWEELDSIAEDFDSRRASLVNEMEFVRRKIDGFPGVHSTRARIKSTLSLIGKCIRKRIAQPDREITKDTYLSRFDDLIGVRALHLVKSDWLRIHDQIRDTWELHEQPTANIRHGDPAEFRAQYESNGCTIAEHARGYRSVHYVLNMNATKRPARVEVQVRTLFEEGWSEIDHTLNYPHGAPAMMAAFILNLNRLSGAADEMAQYAFTLREAMTEVESKSLEQVNEIAALKRRVADLEGASGADPTAPSAPALSPTLEREGAGAIVAVPHSAESLPAWTPNQGRPMSVDEIFARIEKQYASPAQLAVDSVVRKMEHLQGLSSPGVDAIMRIQRSLDSPAMRALESMRWVDGLRRRR